MNLARLATLFYGAALLTLPWVGVGVLKLATGRDWGGGLQPSWVFLAAAVMCAFADTVRKGAWRPGPWSDLDPGLRRWWLLGAAAVLLAVFFSLGGLWVAPASEPLGATFQRFVKQVVQLAVMGVFALWPALWTRGRARWAWTVKLLLIGGAFQILYGCVQGVDYFHSLPGFSGLDNLFTSNPSILSGSGELYLGDSFRNVPRLRGTVCEPLYLGNYLVFLWPLTLIPFWAARNRRLIAVGLLVLLLGTWSRGAWLGFLGQLALALVMVASLRPKARLVMVGGSRRRILWTAGGAALVLAAVFLVGWAFGWEGLLYPFRRLYQTFSNQDWSNLTRLYSMQAAWRAFLLSPILGIGWGQFGWHFPVLVDPMGLQSQFTWPVVNNFPLLILCETGLLGFLVFAGWLAGLARGLKRRWFGLFDQEGITGGQASRQGRLLLAVSISAAGVLFQLLTFSQYNLPHIWVSLGLVMALIADPDLRRSDGPEPDSKDEKP